MSRKKVLTAAKIRAEIASRQITRRSLAKTLGWSEDYIKKILQGRRTAEAVRRQITDYLYPPTNKEMRGIS